MELSISQDTRVLQLHAIAVYKYLHDFSRFENVVKDFLGRSRQTFEESFVNKLYFFYGGKLGTYIDAQNDSRKLTEVKYKRNEQFNSFSINEMLKLFKGNPQYDFNNWHIESVERARISYGVIDISLKFVKMRNKLAHETNSISFDSSDYVELVSIPKIVSELSGCKEFSGYDLNDMDELSQYILSNIIYIHKVISEFSHK